MEVLRTMRDEAIEIEREEGGYHGRTYASSEQSGAKPVLAIHAEARDSEDPKAAGRTSAPPPCARVGGPSSMNWGIWKWRDEEIGQGSRAEPNEEGYWGWA
jgi:hypothetical protein